MRIFLACIISIVLTMQIAIAQNIDESKSVRKIEFLEGKVTRDTQQSDRPVIETTT